MPSPSSSLATLRPDLASFMAYDLEARNRGYIASRVAPIVQVAKPSGTFGKIPLAQLLMNRDTLRAPGAAYSRSQFTFLPATYVCNEHGAEEPLDDKEAEIYSDYFDAEQICTARAFDAVLTNAEKRMAAALFNTTTWTGATLTTTVSVKWDVPATAVPITDVKNARKKVWDLSGLWSNAVILSQVVLEDLRMCQQIIDRVAAQGAGDRVKPTDLTAQQIANCLNVDYLLVAGAIKNSAAEGQAATVASCWADTMAMVARVAVTRDMREPCVARTFHYAADGSQPGGTIESYRDETVRSNIYRVRHDVGEQVLYPEAAHLLQGVK